MKIGRRGMCLVLVAAVLFAAENGYNLFQKGLAKERAEADIRGAVRIYEQVVRENAKDHKLAAQSLFRIGECQQALGDKEARKVYERLLRDYPDQNEIAVQAQARLAAMGSAPAAGSGIVTRQVWTGPKVDSLGAISPDGRVLSFTDWPTGDLALHDLTTGQDRRLTNKAAGSAEYAYGSVISPDGKQVAYGWTLSVEGAWKDHFFALRLIDLKGGEPRVLFANHDVEWIDLHDWSPDGTWLAVQLWRVDQTKQIGLVSTADGALRVLKSVDRRGASKMAFSPDGRFLAYDIPAGQDSEQRDIYVMAVDGGRDTPAVAHSANDKVLGWSLDGKHLLFASDRSSRVGVWALPIADGKPKGGPTLIKADINPGPMGLTRSGALYYSVVAGSDIHVASVDYLETGDVLSPPVMIAQQNTGFSDLPSWSPDGKYLAYFWRSSNSRDLRTLVIRSMETGKVSELRPNLAQINNTPRWSPDGSFFAVTGRDKKGRHGIHRIDRQNGEVSPLVISEPGHGILGAWGMSPDGKTLFIGRYDRDSKKNVLLARDMQSGKERELVRRDGLGARVAISSGGRLLAITEYDSSRHSASLLLVPVEGGEPRELLRVSDPETLGSMVAWSPDGKSLIFRKVDKRDMTRHEFWRIAVAGGAPRKVELNVAWRTPEFNPDGRQIAFTMGLPTTEIWAMENFLAALK